MKIINVLFCSIIAVCISFSSLFTADLVEYEKLDEKPQIIKSATQVYPEKARKDNLTGTTFVEVQVDTEGKVVVAKVKESSGHTLLDEAAIEAAKKFEFSSGMKDGKAVSTLMVIPFKFSLTKDCDKKKK
jgi:TonB family protein